MQRVKHCSDFRGGRHTNNANSSAGAASHAADGVGNAG